VEYDIAADWRINWFCNFRCKYCFISTRYKQNPEYMGHNIEKIIEAFNRTGFVWLIHMSGGEPFFQPQFVELCKELTKKHYISIDTNLSPKKVVYDFADQIDPSRIVFVNCSLHIEERGRLNLVKEFIANYHYLKRYGFKATVNQVLYPPVLKRFDEVFEYLKENGIILRPLTFMGYYKFWRYPASYTEEERKRILKYFEICEEFRATRAIPIPDRKFIYGDLSFKGSLCKAGKKFVAIYYDGDIMRCQSESFKIGNIFEGELNLFEEPRPCNVEICVCPFYGLKYAEGDYKVVRRKWTIDGMKNMAKETISRIKGDVYECE